MANINIILPSMGEGITEATITKWLKNLGEKVVKDEPLVEVATDKVDSEIPATESGILVKIIFKEGSVIPVGETIAIIENEAIQTTESPINRKIEIEKSTSVDIQSINLETSSKTAMIGHQSPGGKFLTPLVRSIAQKEGISASELDNISGSGVDNRITKEDIINYLIKKPQNSTQSIPELKITETTSVPIPKTVKTGNYEIVEMERMRRLIAEHMVHSKHVAPHVTSFIEADVTNLVKWRDQVKNQFQTKYNEKLTFTPIFLEATASALKEFPLVNVSLDDTKILIKKDINIGMAAATNNGNLIVPVVKNADLLSLAGLAKQVNDLANRAKNNKLKPDEITGGTFTITNLGAFGSITGTPIINQPESAILATGAIKKKPAVIETKEGDFIAIRHILVLSLSYDHRIIDGALGGFFLKHIADYLENFDISRKI